MQNLVFIIGLSIFTVSAYALQPIVIDSYDWGLKKSADDIQIFSAKVKGSSHRAVLSKVIVDYSCLLYTSPSPRDA